MHPTLFATVLALCAMLAVVSGEASAGNRLRINCKPFTSQDSCQGSANQKKAQAAKPSEDEAAPVKKKKREAVRKTPDAAKKKVVKRTNDQAAPKTKDQAKSDSYDIIQQKTEAALAISDAKAFVATSEDATLDGLISESISRLEKALGKGSSEEIETLTAMLQEQLAQVQTRLRLRTQPGLDDKPIDQKAFIGQKRVALVIGNSKYRSVSALRNPANDARDMAGLLKHIGFTVTALYDLDKAAFEEALAAFAEESVGSDLSMLYYAGHGIEVDKRNYLIPTDAKLTTDRRLRFEAVALDDILAMLDAVKGIRVVFLDACRSNPFAEKMRMTVASRSVIGRGFTGIEAPYGTVVSYSAKEGTVAADGMGRNSPFTAALFNNIAEPGLEIQFLLRRVRDSVRTATDGEQEPFISASLPGDYIYLVPPSP